MINHEIFFKGLKSNLGVRSPTISLAACFVALGALLKDAGFNLQQSAASSIFTYALPGQLVMAESLLNWNFSYKYFYCCLACKLQIISNDSFFISIIGS